MSSINDALKEADQASVKSTLPETGHGIRPMEFIPRVETGPGYLLPALIVVVMIISAVMMFQWFRGGSAELKVRARSIESNTAVTPDTTPAALLPVEIKPLPAVEAKPVTVASTNAVESKPAPITYKLQGIIYQPNHSSAVINGKTVVVGEHVGDARVIKIDQDSATIATPAGQTIELQLP